MLSSSFIVVGFFVSTFFSPLFVSFYSFVCKMSGFGRICCDNGSYLVDDIRLDHDETMKAYGESGTLMELEFIVPSKKTNIG